MPKFTSTDMRKKSNKISPSLTSNGIIFIAFENVLQLYIQLQWCVHTNLVTRVMKGCMRTPLQL